jgi:hypothetical protein
MRNLLERSPVSPASGQKAGIDLIDLKDRSWHDVKP